jgi:precorrin-6Y C5,15-methyltransferase (decarboxylating)
MKPVSVIGMGMSPEDLTGAQLAIIRQAEVLVGGKRHLEHFKDLPAEKKVIGKDIDGVIELIRDRMEHRAVVVLASGDPLFYGIGTRLIKSLGREHVFVYPNVSSVAAAFSRIGESWEDVPVVSLHGKKNENALFRALDSKSTVAVLTDPRRNPTWLARCLIEKEYLDLDMCVFEQIGSSAEYLQWVSLQRAAEEEFSAPNLVVLKRRLADASSRRPLHLGVPDHWYAHEEGLITKAEVRAVSLAKLRLFNDHVLWDLGAGSGSVSIEASLLIKKGKIVAIEKNPERIGHIKVNCKRFNVRNIDTVQSDLPQGLASLPRPDRIFIGGGGVDLPDIIQAAVGYLKPEGIIVVNTVLIQNVVRSIETLQQNAMTADVVQIQVHRGQDMPWGQRLEAANPVWIISGKRRTA